MCERGRSDIFDQREKRREPGKEDRKLQLAAQRAAPWLQSGVERLLEAGNTRVKRKASTAKECAAASSSARAILRSHFANDLLIFSYYTVCATMVVCDWYAMRYILIFQNQKPNPYLQ